MLTKERRSAIAVLVGERGAVDVKELTTRFGVTNETVRKDLIALEQEGLIERTHGGALAGGKAAPATAFLPDKAEP